MAKMWRKLFLWTMFNSLVKSDLLYRVTSGGSSHHEAGLWGGDIDLKANGRTADLFQYGYDSFNTSSGRSHEGMRIDYVTHDPISMKALMIIKDEDAPATSTQQAVAIGDLCNEGDAHLDILLTNYVFVDEDNPFLLERDCGWRCGWGPFAYTEGRLYFLFSAVFGASFTQLRHEIQLRMMHQNRTGCITMQENGVNELTILQCSDLVHTLHSEAYVKPSPKVYASTTTSLKVVTIDNHMHFFTQLVDTSDVDNPSLNLLHVANNQTFSISRSTIDVIYTGNLKIRGFAAVDYRDGVLCWSSSDRLHCALYALNGEQPHVAKVLEKGEATIRKVCATGE